MGAIGHVVVVGGGIVGLSSAYMLRRRGVKVTVVDRAAIGSGASHGNCGYVCPSHVLPLTEPGVLTQGLKSAFDPDAPLKIGFRLNIDHWWWLFQFARRCNPKQMHLGARAIQPLLQSSWEIYQQWVRTDKIECEWQHRGLLYVYRDKRRFENYAHHDEILRQYNMPARKIAAGDLHSFEPALLKTGLVGGWYYEQDAHIRPNLLMANLRKKLETDGVAFRENCQVTGFAVANGKAAAVRTAAGEIPCDGVIVAAGAMTTLLQKDLGCRIPIQPGKGYSITMPRPAICPKIPMIFPEHRVAVTPMDTGYRLGSMMELIGYDTAIPERRIALLGKAARLFLQQPMAEPILEKWYGWRPMTPDTRPLIGPTPAAGNLLVAAGNNMIGISTGPATGQLAVELLLGQKPHLEVKPYELGRF